MKRAVKQIFILPVISFVLTLVAFLISFNILLQNIAETKFEKEKEQLLKIQKKVLKSEIDAIISGVDQIRYLGYSLAYNELKTLLELINTQHVNKMFIKNQNENILFWYKKNSEKYPKNIKISSILISDKKYDILIYKNKKYLTVYKKNKNLTYGVALSLNLIKNTIKENVFRYLDKINKGKISYVAMGQILTWEPEKDGVFGKIIYMPKPLHNLIGKKLSINSPDIKGNFYRKTY